MGDPRKIRSKYHGPRHPWNKDRIEQERLLVREYGLGNKKELWKAQSKLKNFKDLTKRLIAQRTEQAEKEKTELFAKMSRYGLLDAQGTADTVLGLGTEKLLDRRLQTIVHKQGHARSVRQARQFITHGHIMVGKNKVTVPGYLVSLAEQTQISFLPTSTLAS